MWSYTEILCKASVACKSASVKIIIQIYTDLPCIQDFPERNEGVLNCGLDEQHSRITVLLAAGVISLFLHCGGTMM